MAEVGIVTRKPRLPGVLVRALLITFVLTLLGFALCLLLAIIGLSLFGLVRGHRPDMAYAYKYIAVPMAAVIALSILITATFSEFRRYRRRLAAWRGF